MGLRKKISATMAKIEIFSLAFLLLIVWTICYFKKRIVQFLKKHSEEMLLLIIGIALFFYGLWQLDLIVVPKIDWTRNSPPKEILPGWFMQEADAYVMFIAWITAGYFISLLAMWLWEDS